MPVHWLVTGLLVFSSLCLADEESTTPSASVTTTAPVYLPHYDSDAWSVVRGSIIGQVRSRQRHFRVAAWARCACHERQS
jgi:hypothetical protein